MKNKNLLTRLTAAGTMAVMLMPMSAFAAVEEDITVTKEEADAGTTEDTDVLYSQASRYSVVIPKRIVLDGQTKASDYTVKVSGDISSDKQVKVAPDASFVMKDQGTVEALKKDDVTATVTQAEKIWTSAQVCVENGTIKKGNVSAEDLTSGSWKGTFTFNIALEAVE